MTPKELRDLYNEVSIQIECVTGEIEDLAEEEAKKEDLAAYLEAVELSGDLKLMSHVLTHKWDCMHLLFALPHYRDVEELDYELATTYEKRLTDYAREIKKSLNRGHWKQPKYRDYLVELDELALYLEDAARKIRRG